MSTAKTRLACVVITYNRDDFIETCIASLLASRSDRLDVSVTVVNNGSPDRTADILAGYPQDDLTAINNETNQPLSRALNAGLDRALASDAEYIILLNDDIEMRAGALAELVEVCAEVEGSIVTPLQIDYRNPEVLDAGMLQKVQATPDLVTDAVYRGEIKRYYTQTGMIGSAIMASRETFEAVGHFDPLFAFYGLDDDYFRRASRLGRPLLLATRAKMLHMHGRLVAARTADPADWLKRWKTSFRGQKLHKLKSPERSLPMNYLRVILGSLQKIPANAIYNSPRTAVETIRILAELIGSYGEIAARRREERSRVERV